MSNPPLFPLFDEVQPPTEDTVKLDQVRQRDRSVPLIIADGMGVDSTAMLLVLKAHGIRPDLILFADTGGEKPETYQHIDLRRAWLAASGFPPLVVVRYTPKKVPDRTLEDQCLRTKTLTEPGLWRQELFPEMEGRATEPLLRPLGARPLVLASRKEAHQGNRI